MNVTEALESQLHTNRLIWLNNRKKDPEKAQVALETIDIVLDMYPDAIPRDKGMAAFVIAMSGIDFNA